MASIEQAGGAGEIWPEEAGLRPLRQEDVGDGSKGNAAPGPGERLSGDRFRDRLASARRGSREAVADLVEQCRQYLWLVADREISPALRPKIAPSDLVQDTYREAAEKFEQFRGATQAEFVAWLLRILESKLKRVRRTYETAQKRNVRRELPVDSDAMDLLPALSGAGVRTPGSEAAAREMVAALNESLVKLPDEYRQAIELRSWQRKSFAEIGIAMGRTPEAARKLWCRAIERLGRELERFGGES
jgi:RNA polymerase sigma-70 factor (ECF subfamily)